MILHENTENKFKHSWHLLTYLKAAQKRRENYCLVYKSVDLNIDIPLPEKNPQRG